MTTYSLARDQLKALGAGDLDAIGVLMTMHEGNLEASGLDKQTWELVRVAALATLDASPESWYAHLSVADEMGMNVDQIIGTLIAIAPIVGTARVVSAGDKIARAVGIEEEIAAKGS